MAEACNPTIKKLVNLVSCKGLIARSSSKEASRRVTLRTAAELRSAAEVLERCVEQW